MMSPLAILLHLLLVIQVAHATIYVTAPGQGSTCHGGQSCQVQWIEDGEVPFLTTIGACHVGLYNGNGVLVQQIDPANVGVKRSLRFTPDPEAGPNSRNYYVNFTSVDVIGNPPQHYTQFSPSFALDGMSGAFSDPVSGDTSALPVPSSVLSAPSNTVISTISVGVSSQSVGADPAAASTSHRLTTSRRASVTSPSSTAPVLTSSPASSTTTSSMNSTSSSTSSSGMTTALAPSSSGTSPSSSASATSAASRSMYAISGFSGFAVFLLLGLIAAAQL